MSNLSDDCKIPNFSNEFVAASTRALFELADVGAFDDELNEVLRRHREGESDEETRELGGVLGRMEFYLPALLRTVHPFWNEESLDWLSPARATRGGPWTLELAGLCQLISDKTWTPFEVALRISPTVDRVDWIALRPGEVSDG